MKTDPFATLQQFEMGKVKKNEKREAKKELGKSGM